LSIATDVPEKTKETIMRKSPATSIELPKPAEHADAAAFNTIEKNSRLDVQKQMSPAAPAKKADGGKSQLVALILVIFVGVLGIHRFYLGYTGIGILQLLTGGGCGIWALIDLIRIATGDLKPKDGDYTEKL
jgi:TM2 domain-containing membrane protein YozV